MQPAQIVKHLVVQADNVCLEGRFLPEAANMLLHVFLSLLDDLLDPRGMDAPVLDQPLKSDLGDLAADAVETGDDHHAGRVVDDHVDAGGLFECSDIAPFTADDPTFHLVVGDVDGADGDFGRVRRGVALNRGGEDFAAFLLAGVVNRRLVFQNQVAHLAAQLVLDAFQEQFAQRHLRRGG